MIQNAIERLAEYGVITGLITESDRTYTINRLLELFDLDEIGQYDETTKSDKYVTNTAEGVNGTYKSVRTEDLEDILAEMLGYAFEKGLIPENDIVHRDLFDTKIMGILTPWPGQVTENFVSLYEL